MSSISISFILIIMLSAKCRANDEEDKLVENILSEKYDSYGDDWIFMPDGNNNPQVAVLKGEELEPRGFFDEVVTYLLYTRSHINEAVVLYANESDSIKKSDFSPNRSTKFITHGWKSSAFSSGPTAMKNAYLKKMDCNVILVNWEHMASSTFYLGPMKNTEVVGRDAGSFIDFLISETGTKHSDIHFIGHSLGAHVAGNAGAAVTSGRISRVTGLDPALPGFGYMKEKEKRLDNTDAEFVDVIHTCGGLLGFFTAIGHADFYPNGGVAIQRGCCCMPEMTQACSHGRAFDYFTETIVSEVGFLAYQCPTWGDFISAKCANAPTTFMGEYVDHSVRGSYFLETKSLAPFAVATTIFPLSNSSCIETNGNTTGSCYTN